MKKYMAEALQEARKAAAEGEVPIGAVIVHGDIVIARAHNTKIRDNNALKHAEMTALSAAMEVLESKYLQDCTMYVTIEPCYMCAGAMLNARLGRLVFGAREEKFGCAGSNYDLLSDSRFQHRVVVEEGLMAEECVAVMTEFFQKCRREKC